MCVWRLFDVIAVVNIPTKVWSSVQNNLTNWKQHTLHPPPLGLFAASPLFFSTDAVRLGLGWRSTMDPTFPEIVYSRARVPIPTPRFACPPSFSCVGYPARPLLNVSLLQCEPGHYCVDGVRFPCPAGRSGPLPRENRSECEAECMAGWYCPEGSVSAKQVRQTRYLVFASSSTSRPLPSRLESSKKSFVSVLTPLHSLPKIVEVRGAQNFRRPPMLSGHDLSALSRTCTRPF